MKKIVARTLLACAVSLSLSSVVHAYEVVQIDSGGQISGTVRLDGKVPVEQTTVISKDNHICGDGNTVMNPVRIDNDQGVADAVIRIVGIEAGKAWPEVDVHQVLQRDCQFEPYVQVLPRDAELSIVNEDPLLHNIHAYEQIGRARRTLFNIAQPKAGQVDTHALSLRRGEVVEIACDAHNWMSAWIHTSTHPYIVVSADDGTFQMDDIPPGDYEVTIWHPVLGSSTQEVTVSAAQATTLDVAIGSNDG